MRPTPLLVAALLAGAAITQDPGTTKPATAVRLVYELPVDALQRAHRGDPDFDLERALADTIANVARRMPERAEVTRGDGATFAVGLWRDSERLITQARALVETAGTFEMRIVANGDYAGGDVRFDLAAERAALQAWLDAGGRERLAADPTVIREFTPGNRALGWYVHRIEVDPDAAGRWQTPLARSVPDAVVAAYRDSDWNDGAVPPQLRQQPAEARFLVELVALNLHEEHFDNADLDPDGVAATQDGNGQPAVDYRLVDARAMAYSDWSARNVDQHAAMVWNGEVLRAPRFLCRIPGHGRITGLPTRDARAVAQAMVAPLPFPPKLLRIERP
ncbi:MAG: hypothetical protein KDE27_14945 [Planctomycetes bacterium]|nr:hypothetical protein [Planctomycetota bacterium]